MEFAVGCVIVAIGLLTLMKVHTTMDDLLAGSQAEAESIAARRRVRGVRFIVSQPT
jgi:hypothetical protein